MEVFELLEARGKGERERVGEVVVKERKWSESDRSETAE